MKGKFWIFFSLGWASQVCQVTLLRELLTIAEGTELTIAFVLGAWLVLIALGSFAASKLLASRKQFLSPLTIYALLSLLLSAVSFLDIWFIRSSRMLFSLPPGEPLSVSQWLAVALAALLPVCISFGAQFVFAASFAGAAKVYIAESLGAVFAGMAMSLLLLQWLDHTSLLACSLALHLLFSLWAVLKFQPNVSLATALVSAAALTLIASPFLEHYTQICFWSSMLPSGKLVRLFNSPYGQIAVVRYGDQLSVYRSGHLLFTFSDQTEVASLVHLILLQHPRPNRVLLIGGLGGWVKAALEHPEVVKVDWVEIDSAIPKLVLPFLPERERNWLSDPKLELHFSDGRSFVRKVSRPYDVVIVVASDPTTAEANRFFTLEFFAEVLNALLPDGVFALHGLQEPPAGFSEIYYARNHCVYRTMLKAFYTVLVIPSSPLTLVACYPRSLNIPALLNSLTLHERTLLKRAEERGLKLDRLNLFAFTEPVQVERVNFEVKTGLPFNPLEREQIKKPKEKGLNTDANPSVYFLSSLLWLRMGSEKIAKFLEAFLHLPFWSIAALPILILLLWLFDHHRYGGRSAPLIAIAVIGAVGMLTELTILLVFQSRFGTLYQQVALLFALFMLGLAFGACLFESWHKLRFTLSLPVLAVLTGLATLSWCGLSLTISLMPSIFVAILCWIFMVLIGCCVGAAFPATVFALENLGFEGEKSVGWAYGYDLVGGAIGAFLIGSIILPLWGTTASLSVCSATCFLSALLFVLKGR